MLGGRGAMERERRIGMVKRRWMEGRGNSRGRRITCKHVSTFDRSVGELGALATMSGARAALLLFACLF